MVTAVNQDLLCTFNLLSKADALSCLKVLLETREAGQESVTEMERERERSKARDAEGDRQREADTHLMHSLSLCAITHTGTARVREQQERYTS